MYYVFCFLSMLFDLERGSALSQHVTCGCASDFDCVSVIFVAYHQPKLWGKPVLQTDIVSLELDMSRVRYQFSVYTHRIWFIIYRRRLAATTPPPSVLGLEDGGRIYSNSCIEESNVGVGNISVVIVEGSIGSRLSHRGSWWGKIRPCLAFVGDLEPMLG
jgi:hypothetical protein